MTNPRMRMLAGPNGSGKSTLFDFLRTRARVNLGHLLNPDDLEREIARLGRYDFGGLNIVADNAAIQKFFRDQSSKLNAALPALFVEKNILTVTEEIRNTYFTSVLCDYLRHQWLAEQQTFSFETVMSHPSKVALLQEALDASYRTYLYFVCTADPRINEERVAGRVESGGHGVPASKITERYYRSLELLPRAIQLSNRAYLIDNSGKQHQVVAEFEDGRLLSPPHAPPQWCIESALEPLGF